ncbi:MAG: STAS domain-containing protein [Planctomycetota bacterium]|jgi:anti-sigma B factor antagonist
MVAVELYYDDVDGDVLIIKADGGLNAETTEKFVSDIETLVDAGLTKIIVDCERLEYISSRGLGVLVRLHKQMKQHKGDVKIASAKSALLDVLRLTRLDRHLEIYPDVSRARLAFKPKSESTGP